MRGPRSESASSSSSSFDRSPCFRQASCPIAERSFEVQEEKKECGLMLFQGTDIDSVGKAADAAATIDRDGDEY